jgi:hypothetical protein
MKITAPYGYGEIVPLKKDHRVLLPEGATPAFCRTLNALAISVGEFSAAARDYPIVFASLDRGKTFAPVVVVGLAPGSNLFVDQAGQWDRTAYFPAFVRRYPFCISKLYVDGEAKTERVVCVAKACIDPAGVPLFDAGGTPSARWQDAERLLSGYETDLDRTAQMCAALARLQVFETFTLQWFNERQEPQVKLAGMYRVSETKLRELKAAIHKALVTKGFMGPMYAHLHSLENFRRLLSRRNSGS